MNSVLSPVQQIRLRSNKASEHRRNVALLSALGAIDFTLISLFQLGVIKRLPDLPGKVFDTNKVNASEDAQILGLPDGPVSLLMYAANIVLAGMALKQGKKRNVFDYLMGGIALGQAAGGAYYLYNMAAVQKKVCIYCVKGALINFAVLVPLTKLINKGK